MSKYPKIGNTGDVSDENLKKDPFAYGRKKSKEKDRANEYAERLRQDDVRKVNPITVINPKKTLLVKNSVLNEKESNIDKLYSGKINSISKIFNTFSEARDFASKVAKEKIELTETEAISRYQKDVHRLHYWSDEATGILHIELKPKKQTKKEKRKKIPVSYIFYATITSISASGSSQ